MMDTNQAHRDYGSLQPRSEIEALEFRLSDIAAEWRMTKDPEYIKQYHDAYHKLRKLGWNGSIDLDSMLPTQYMPQDYMDQITSTERRS
jgi:hypothetical protein